VLVVLSVIVKSDFSTGPDSHFNELKNLSDPSKKEGILIFRNFKPWTGLLWPLPLGEPLLVTQVTLNFDD
jgi:hypothetical protein